MLRAYFGTDDVHVVVDSAPTGPSKSFDDVDDLKADIILGRIYGGMHYRNSMNVGQLVARYPRPVENLRRAIRELRTSSTAAISAGRSERSPYSRREGPSS